MANLRARLFGKCSIRCDDSEIKRLDGGKVMELFCYLLLHNSRPHAREHLASLLWGDSTTAQSKKYLRQALWQLQGVLQVVDASTADQLLIADVDWVRVDAGPQIWLDVVIFEHALASIRGIAGVDLDDAHAQLLREATQLYCGDLLEGWYQDWCVYERERLQNAYLALLDKLMAYCEVRQQYDDGLHYGDCILHYDRARTHAPPADAPALPGGRSHRRVAAVSALL